MLCSDVDSQIIWTTEDARPQTGIVGSSLGFLCHVAALFLWVDVSTSKTKAFCTIRKKVRLLKITDGKCAYCGKQLTWYVGRQFSGRIIPENAFTVDHVIPKKQFKWFGSNGYKPIENQVACCAPCNVSKGNKIYIDEWEPGLKLTDWEKIKAEFAQARKS